MLETHEEHSGTLSLILALFDRWCCRTCSTCGMDVREEGVCTSQSPVSFMWRSQAPSSCFSCRANVVIGDIFEPGAQQIVDAINGLPPDNGKACWRRCDVTSWEDQVALFELAMTRFGGVDIVVSAHLVQMRIHHHRMLLISDACALA